MQLLIVTGPDRARTWTLIEGQKVLIGRGTEANLQLHDPHASRKHCQIELAKGEVSVIDCGSAGGTFVNNQAATKRVLRPGDIVRIGDTEIQLQADASADNAATRGSGAAPAPAVAALDDLQPLVGQKLAHFQIERVIATGKRGMIFFAKDTDASGREVALKVLWPSISKDEEEMQRFVRAMKTMLPVQHPNIVRLYNAGKTGRYCWLAMEHVVGESAAQMIERIGTVGMLDWQNAYRVAVHIARALEAAAQHHIVHRNISPENILVQSGDKVAKLGDLMLAKAFEGARQEQITGRGELVGDLAYMSPEATHDTAELDARSDIYSLGATVYALLTGRPPIEGKSLVEVIGKVRNDAPVSPKRYQLSINDMFEGIVMRMLAKDPKDRFESPSQLLKDLERVGKFQGIIV